MGQDQQNAKTEPGTGSGSVLQRKAASGRADHQARAMTLARALRLSIAKVADDVFEMAMATLSLRTQEVSGPGLFEFFDDGALLLLCDGPMRRRAAVVVDPLLVGALIQKQTIGQVMPDDASQQRSMTGTDAAICAPFLDAVLQRAEGLPEAEEERDLIGGYRFGARAEDARLLHLSMEAPLYQVIQISIDVERGKRQGDLVLCLPLPQAAARAQDGAALSEKEPHEKSKQPKHNLEETVSGLKIELSLILATLKMPLHGVSALEDGDVLQLEAASFDAVDIRTLQGRKVGQGVLGQIEGHRAVRIEHKDQMVERPQRRSEDREGLNQVELGTIVGTNSQQNEDDPPRDLALSSPENTTHYRHEETGPAEADNLPDMSDIPDFDNLALPDAAVG